MDELEKPLQKTPAIKDLCRAMWSEDKIVYESTIKDIQKSEGKDYCTVQFLYYGNEDSVSIIMTRYRKI